MTNAGRACHYSVRSTRARRPGRGRTHCILCRPVWTINHPSGARCARRRGEFACDRFTTRSIPVPAGMVHYRARSRGGHGMTLGWCARRNGRQRPHCRRADGDPLLPIIPLWAFFLAILGSVSGRVRPYLPRASRRATARPHPRELLACRALSDLSVVSVMVGWIFGWPPGGMRSCDAPATVRSRILLARDSWGGARPRLAELLFTHRRPDTLTVWSIRRPDARPHPCPPMNSRSRCCRSARAACCPRPPTSIRPYSTGSGRRSSPSGSASAGRRTSRCRR